MLTCVCGYHIHYCVWYMCVGEMLCSEGVIDTTFTTDLQ